MHRVHFFSIALIRENELALDLLTIISQIRNLVLEYHPKLYAKIFSRQVLRGIYFAKYYGGGEEWPAGGKMGLGKK